MATTVARLNAVIGVDIDPLKRGIAEGKRDLEGFADSAEKTGSKFGTALAKIDHQKIKDVGATMTVGMTLPLIAAGGAALKMASSANEAANKVKVVFGESAKIVTDFAEKSATAFGMSGGEANKAAGTFGNLFKTIGLGTKPAADMSVSLLKLAADLASFNDIPIEDALEKLRAGLVGEAEPMRALGVLINEAAVETKALAMGLEQVDGKFTESAKVQARYALIMEQTKTAQGDFARTSGDLANATRGLEAEFKELGEQLGKELLPLAKDVVGVTLGLVKGFSELPKPVKDFGFGLGVVAAVAGPLVYTFGALVGLIKNIQAIAITAAAAKTGLAIASGAVATNTAAETIALTANTTALNLNAAAAGRASFAQNLLSKVGGGYGLGRGIGTVAGPLAALAIPHAIAHSMGMKNPPGPGDAFKPFTTDIARRLGLLPSEAKSGSMSVADIRMRDDTNTSASASMPGTAPGAPNLAPFAGGVLPQAGYSSAQYRADNARSKVRVPRGILPPTLNLYGQSQGGPGSVQTVSDGRPRIPSLPDWMQTGPAGVIGGDMVGPGGAAFYRPQSAQAQLPQIPTAPGVQQIVLNVQPGASVQDILRLIQQQLERSSRGIEYGPSYP